MLTFEIAVYFEKGYIADPYWPEMARVIDIQKQSGMNRARTEANRRKALQEHLESIEMSLAQYDALVEASKRPFHTGLDGRIVVPADKVAAFLVNTTDMLRAASKPCPADHVRSLIRFWDWETEKTEADGKWERFAVVQSAAGKLSNQRGLRTSLYIRDFTATGRLGVDPDFVKPEVLEKAIRWGGENIGIGASRKMGWGRFDLRSFEQTHAAAA